MVLVKPETVQKNENRPTSITPHKSSSKWTKDLNIRSDMLNLIDKKMGNKFELIDTGKNYLNRTPIA